jgi:hypothetical protein
MRSFPWVPLIVAGGIGVLTLGAPLRADTWTSEFPIDKQDLASTGRNPYFILESGYTIVLRGGNEELTITVLNETKMVDGVETRVVEEREGRQARRGFEELLRDQQADQRRVLLWRRRGHLPRW